MRRILLSVDMEGVAGVASRAALTPQGWEWMAARKWMTNELNAVAEAAFEAGYDEVIATDSHSNAQNIDPDLLLDNIRLVRSWPRPLLQMQMIDDPATDACAFIGYHAAAGTTDAILNHSFSSAAFRSIRLNGEIASEGYFNAALAGEFGKPVLLVSGDQHTIEDAKRYAPEAALFATKHSFGQLSQASLPPRQICQGLKVAAREAFAAPTSTPFKLDSPYELLLEMASHGAAEMLGYLPWTERIDTWTIRAEFESMREAMHFITFAILYSPSGQTPFN
ncbi:M55 family metallopeptidase [Tsuneonella sp. HG094]